MGLGLALRGSGIRALPPCVVVIKPCTSIRPNDTVVGVRFLVIGVLRGCPSCKALVAHEKRLALLAAGETPERLVTTGPRQPHGTSSCYPKSCRRPECLEAIRKWRRERREALAAEQGAAELQAEGHEVD